MKKSLAFFFIGIILSFSAAANHSLAGSSIALYYGNNAPLNELHAFDIAVVDPGHGYDPQKYRTANAELFAYVSVGEIQASRPYFNALPENWRLGKNTAWDSIIIDQAQSAWPDFFADKVVAPLWQAGYRGFFLDTLDSYRLINNVDEKAQQQGLTAVIRKLSNRFPGIRLIANRGFEILPDAAPYLMAVAAESLFRGWDANTKRYVEVKPADREWLLAQLNNARDRYSLAILAIDYVLPTDKALMRTTAERIRQLGFIPWVSDYALQTLGISNIEIVPRKILVLYNGLETPALNYDNGHLYLDLPINHLGYVPIHVDVQQGLPDGVLTDRYAGIVTWFSGNISGNQRQATAVWLRRQIEAGMKVVMFGQFGIGLEGSNARTFDLITDLPSSTGKISIVSKDAMMGFEAQPAPDKRVLIPLNLGKNSLSRSLLQFSGTDGNRYDAAAITKWGGFVLDPFAVIQVPGTETHRWVIDPFTFLTEALRLPVMPVPDATTENGNRLLLIHIDGDGFPSKAEQAGAPFASAVLLNEVLKKYRFPTTVSVIEAEISPDGLYPQFSKTLETIAKQMFSLPYTEIASHTYSHPFSWAKAEAKKDPDDPDAYYALRIPNYTIDLKREIVGSIDYIRRRLAPANKPVNILLWSGDAAPGEESLKIAYEAGLLNMNGGKTAITRSEPTITTVYPLGIEKGGLFQIYAPVTNENVYTNLWHGPYYGFERVIETFEMTEKPRRLKPINIYYHVYSASKRAGLQALHRVYAWTEKQSTTAVYASEYIRKVMDFNNMVIARKGNAWLIRSNGELRTLRAPSTLGKPNIAESLNVAGYNDNGDERYLHLSGSEALVRFSTTPKAVPYLLTANGKITSWQANGSQLDFTISGHMPLQVSLGDADHCDINRTPHRVDRNVPTDLNQNKRSLVSRTQPKQISFRIPDATATFKIRCKGN